MRQRRVERGLGAVELRQRRGVNIGEAIEKRAQLRERCFVSRLIGERGAADEFRRRYLAGLRRLAFDEFLVPRRDGNDQPSDWPDSLPPPMLDMIIYMILRGAAMALEIR